MRKPGTDPNNVQMSDVLCDFCRAEWDESEPMLEGHQGACICGRCLTAAYTEGVGSPPQQAKCTMCLEERNEPFWKSPATGAMACRRCIKLAAGALERDPDFSWARPGRAEAGGE